MKIILLATLLITLNAQAAGIVMANFAQAKDSKAMFAAMKIAKPLPSNPQLDAAPLTFEEVTKIKNSFQFTLLNMLHSRVAYPPAGEQPTAARA